MCGTGTGMGDRHGVLTHSAGVYERGHYFTYVRMYRFCLGGVGFTACWCAAGSGKGTTMQ